MVDVAPVVGVSFGADDTIIGGYIQVYFALMFGGAIVGHLRDRNDFAYLLLQLEECNETKQFCI